MSGHRLIDPVELPDYRLTVGLIFVQGVGYRVGTWDGYESRQMSPAAARRFARDLGSGEAGDALLPVISAINTAADKVDGLASATPHGTA
jgi:hypothetical protein